MKKRKNWLDIAMELPQGHKTRADCVCGTGNTLVINHNPESYSMYCFRCDEQEAVPIGVRTLADLREIRELNVRAAEPFELDLPTDFTTEIPIEGKLWLYKASIHMSDWREFNIGYSPSLKRVILPVYKNGELVYWQARAVFKGQKPKYINPAAEKNNVLCKIHHSFDAIVITEDILSCIRVSKFMSCATPIGTKLSTPQVIQLSGYKHVLVWMDDDLAGRKASYKMSKTIGLLTQVTQLRSSKDPKMLDNTAIEGVIYAAQEQLRGRGEAK